MASHELYVKGARVWIPNPETVWQSAVITRPYKPGDTTVYLRVEAVTDTEETAVHIKDESELPPLRNPSSLIGQNDLTALSYLHEPDVLHNLQVRFCERQNIYTYCGIVLVAINPYAELPLYGQDLINAYRGHSLGQLEPHIFAIAEDAYTKLEREKCNISIIVSGESGAGKTVSAKYAMRYFAAVGGNESETNIERKVLASSPIMEAIGNAKTTRNDNSSRFGKFTKLLFSRSVGNMALKGASMQTYLLEKSRVVFQAPGERNYHIFYQLCAARNKWPALMLDHQDTFRFLNQGSSPNISRVSDLDSFSETVNALLTLGFSNDDVKGIMTILAGILHLGNVHFQRREVEGGGGDGEESDVLADDLHLGVLCDLLQLNVEEMRRWLTMRQIESVNEVVNIPMSCDAAEAARDALSKHVYAKLFQHIVQVINRGLGSGSGGGGGASKKSASAFIGVLDIYGFETFQVNSFEQFCINFANEKLQQQFTQHVFKLEQEEYLREGITWTMIDYYDNQPCIDLIEDKLGILALLDEECRMPRGSDKSWVMKILEKCAKYKHFEKTKFGGDAFLVHHFSDTVQYESFGFVEKNRDTVSKELVNVIAESGMSLCYKLMTLDDVDHSQEPEEKSASGTRVIVSAAKVQTTPSKQHRKTVGSQFRESLALLIDTLHSTTPHYVRCIKPNDDKQAFEWEPSKIVQQLRACGVLETVRISAAGFPSRAKYEDFLDRYDLLAKSSQIQEDNMIATVYSLITNWIQDEDKVRYGKTQLFFRAGQVAYLEQIRADLRKRYIIIVQSLVKRYIYQKRYKRIRASVLGIQKYARGLLARRRAQVVRETRAVIVIQKHIRGWLQRIKYRRTKSVVVRLQARCRSYLVRRHFQHTLDNHKAIIIQKFCRGYLARRRFAVKLERIVKCQAYVRRFLARRRYKRLRVEARTVAGMQKKYMGLENKIISMQQRLDEVRTENKSLKVEVAEVPELKSRVEFLKRLENEMKPLREELQSKTDRLIALESELTRERDEKMQILQDRDAELKQWQSEKSVMEGTAVALQHLVEQLKVKEQELTAEVRNMEFTPDPELNEVYHRAVQEKEVLETENNNLREELQRLQLQVNSNHNNNSSMNSSHSLSTNTSSGHTEEDVGYSSAKNTLEMRRDEKVAATPKNNSTAMILRLRKLLEEEKRRSDHLLEKLARYESLKRPFHHSLSPEDRIRLAELEVEHEKLAKDYESLRLGIARGVETQVLHNHYAALQDELKRRKEESVQLKTVLAEQSQSMRSLNDNTSMLDRFQDYTELLEAFQAQKLVNRQLESELTAITEEHNVALREFSRQLDESCSEKNQLHDILNNELQRSDAGDSPVTLNYLRHELEKVTADYLNCLEELNDLKRMNQIFAERLRDHGLNDSILLDEDVGTMALVNKKPQSYQGIFKYRHEDESKIIQRLLTDYSPQVAITLMPGLPAFIFLMCVRYTDLMNADKFVKTLLSNIVTQAKKLFQTPNTLEVRLVVLVNMMKLYDLMRQYGGLDEFTSLNTDMQNQQQLKNFDLSEYRRIILTKIVYFYQVFVVQVQFTMKSLIVPALLEHDETTRGKKSARKSMDSEQVSDPAALVHRLNKWHEQFKYFGLGTAYVGQIFHQLFYYMTAVALNNLMLRSDLCTWRTGMKIRHNTNVLKSWAAEVGLPPGVVTKLDVLLEVSGLLQLRKSDSDTDVKSIVDMCQLLTATQILKIIKLYRSDDAEPPITPQFIDTLAKKLAARQRAENDEANHDTFTMDENFCHPIKVNYEYSDVHLEDIELPVALNLRGILTKI